MGGRRRRSGPECAGRGPSQRRGSGEEASAETNDRGGDAQGQRWCHGRSQPAGTEGGHHRYRGRRQREGAGSKGPGGTDGREGREETRSAQGGTALAAQ